MALRRRFTNPSLLWHAQRYVAVMVGAIGAVHLSLIATSEAEPSRSERSPPWIAPDVEPFPAGVRSVRTREVEHPIFHAPGVSTARRGSAHIGATLPVFAARKAEGCVARWIQIGPSAWLCEDTTELSRAEPLSPHMRTWQDSADGLPFQYYFVGPDGTFGYKRIEQADVGEPDVQLEPGFAVAIVEERLVGGGRYGRTHGGSWLPMRDLGRIQSFAFQGIELPSGTTDLTFAWVVADVARVFRRIGEQTFQSTTESRARLERVMVHDEIDSFSGRFVRVSFGAEEPGSATSGKAVERWMSARDLARPRVTLPPAEVDADAGEHWIDVELSSQTLVAYEGRHPAFATLVSTGKGKKGSSTATPTGTFRVWAKLLTSNMDNLEDEAASRYYRMEDVPYVQYFHKGVGLHGAFWHRSLGRVRSHGCVNLSPLDAQRLFWWTAPRLPAGWTAVLPVAHDRGAVIRVR
ncbi:uncharacterized protein CMC5_007200 [Chondromyces crocatus]|uniref:L,D-TPase catalytic domain-containing protein n=2 Tax=Chondromyces crocatus TaxID=52 RepID=A0A0K1E6V3_CHOCO|nr:uncharacterized protein CMC5_007200 [Chondromyces crocatus]